MPDRLDINELWEVAHIAVSILRKGGLTPCLFGSVAGKTYGVSRTPKDVDIVVFTRTHTAARLKTLLVEADSRFYLIRSGDPFATHKILWFRVGELASNSNDGLRGFSRRCKVDIVIPGDLDIPYLDEQLIVHRTIADRPLGSCVLQQPLPVMPFLHLVCLKVHAWWDHQESNREHFQAKYPTDAKDVQEMLTFALTCPELLASTGAKDDWIGLEESQRDAEKRIHAFIEEYPDTRKQWLSLGFVL